MRTKTGTRTSMAWAIWVCSALPLAAGQSRETSDASPPGKPATRPISDGPSDLTQKPDSPFQNEPAARALYDQMIEAMRKAETLSYESEYRREAKGREWSRCTYTVWLKKPNYFRVETMSAIHGKGGTLIGDGDYLWIHWPGIRPRFHLERDDELFNKTSRNVYMKKPASLGRHSIGHETGVLGVGMGMPILDPSTFHGYTDSLQRYVDGVRSLGTKKIGDEECDGIEVSIMKGQRSWYLWLSKRDHLPRELKQVIRVSYDIVIYETWSNVKINADVPTEQFAWKPPEGWQQWRMPAAEKSFLKPGEKAPDFELLSADRTKIKLSDYRGKVVWFYIWRAG